MNEYDEVKELIDSLRQDAEWARDAILVVADRVRAIGNGPMINPIALDIDIANLQDAMLELASRLNKSLGSRDTYVAGRADYDREVAVSLRSAE